MTSRQIEDLQDALLEMKPEQRVELIGRLMAPYCIFCGEQNFGRVCHCENEE